MTLNASLCFEISGQKCLLDEHLSTAEQLGGTAYRYHRSASPRQIVARQAKTASPGRACNAGGLFRAQTPAPAARYVKERQNQLLRVGCSAAPTSQNSQPRTTATAHVAHERLQRLHTHSLVRKGTIVDAAARTAARAKVYTSLERRNSRCIVARERLRAAIGKGAEAIAGKI